MTRELRRVAVVGLGLMGCGLVESAALAGFEVVAVKATAGDTLAMRTKVGKSLERSVEAGRVSEEEADLALQRIRFASELDAVTSAQLVIECALESAPAKKRLLSEIEGLVGDDTVIATNTSSLRLDDLAKSLRNPHRFLALHFFSPVQAMKLVEVAATSQTTPAALETANAFVRGLGKEAVRVGPTPGYVVNRLLVPMLLHAIETVEAGVATAPEVDAAMKLGCGHPMGPLALCDRIGLDVVLAMAKTLSVELEDARYRAPTLLRRLVLEGHLGRKTGIGFYDYRGKQTVPNPAIDVPSGRAAINRVA
jgi:3-hydroxybutyryl-CoA dehydrogenase